jgi:hypothetical protein
MFLNMNIGNSVSFEKLCGVIKEDILSEEMGEF